MYVNTKKSEIVHMFEKRIPHKLQLHLNVSSSDKASSCHSNDAFII